MYSFQYRKCLNVHSVSKNFCLNIHSLCINFCLNIHSPCLLCSPFEYGKGMYKFDFNDSFSMTLRTFNHRKRIYTYLFHIQMDYIINMDYVHLSTNLYIHHVRLSRNLYLHYVHLSTSGLNFSACELVSFSACQLYSLRILELANLIL